MTATHRLAGRHFDELARGSGGPGVIEQLLAGQLSKRMLQLRAVLDGIGTDPGPEAAAARDAYAVLCDLDISAPDAATPVLLHPQVGAWLARCVAQLCGGRPEPGLVGRLGAVAAAVAIRSGQDVEVTVPVRAGSGMLPMLGRFRTDPGAASVLLRTTGGEVRLRSPAGGTRFVPGPDEAPGWEPLRELRVEAAGRVLAVHLDDLDPYREMGGLPLTDRLDRPEVERWHEVLAATWGGLVRHHTGPAAALAAGLRSIVPLREDRPGQGVSATSVDAFGAAAMSRSTSADTLAVGLLHEFQHSKLSALLDLVPLYDEHAPVRLYAPWRDDPRPLGGLLQGAYAYLGVTGFWRVQRHELTGRPARFADFEFSRWREQALRAVEVLLGSGALTAAGDRFVTGMGDQLTGWRDDPVPAVPAGAAVEANLDHWLTWRARNLHPEPEQVRAAAEAWRSGRPCPPGSTGIPAGGTFVPGVNGRLTLLHARLREPERFTRLTTDPDTLATEAPHTSAADVAFAAGNKAAAIDGYRRLLAADPACAHAWAGLALADGHGADLPLELVRGLYAELAGDADPRALVSWAGAR